MDVMQNRQYYVGYPELPYIHPERDLSTEVPRKLVSEYNMTRLNNGLLPGDIILLWRVSFGTFTTHSWFPKYFEYTYGINAEQSIKELVENDYVEVETAFQSLNHLNAAQVKKSCKKKILKGYQNAQENN